MRFSHGHMPILYHTQFTHPFHLVVAVWLRAQPLFVQMRGDGPPGPQCPGLGLMAMLCDGKADMSMTDDHGRHVMEVHLLLVYQVLVPAFSVFCRSLMSG
jgi:hypothetical protein